MKNAPLLPRALCTAALLLTLAACGGGGGDTPATTPPPANGDTSTGNPAPDKPADPPVDTGTQVQLRCAP